MESQAPTKQTVYGIIPAAEAKGLSGYELMKRIRDGEFPVPPIAKVFNFRLAEVEPGRAVFTGEP